MRRFLLVLLLSCTYLYPESDSTKTALIGQKRPAQTASARIKPLASLGLSFEKNLGQAPGSDFVAYLRGQRVLISASGLSFVQPVEAGLRSADITGQQPLKMQFIGANLSSRALPLGLLPGISNYFAGPAGSWITNVPNYSRIRYENAYPGIDVEYYGNDRQLEYDLAIAPGFDPGKIALQITGSDKVVRSPEGALIATRDKVQLRLNQPVAYQMVNGRKRLVSVRYAVEAGGRFRFQVGAYDRTRKLVIDPIVLYSTFVPALLTTVNNSLSLAIDGSGNSYLGGYDLTGGIVMKLNAAGSAAVYTDHFANAQIQQVAVDSAGNVAATGVTQFSSFATTTGAFQTTCSKCLNTIFEGPNAGIVIKLDTSGNLVYSSFLEGSGDDTPGGVALDGSGNIYISGGTTSSDFPTSAGAFQSTRGGAGDGFITKINPGGHGASDLVYSTHLGGNTPATSNPATSGAGRIAVDVNGNAYVAGGTETSDFPFNSHVNCSGTEHTSHLFAAKLNGNGSQLTYSACLTDPGGNFIGITSVALDSAGDFYVAGSTESDYFPHIKSIQSTPAGQGAGFLVKLNPSGSDFLFTTYLGSTRITELLAVAVDGSQNAYVSGDTFGPGFPLVDPFESDLRAGTQGWIAKLDTVNGKIVYSSFISDGLVGLERPNTIAVDGNGNAYIAGTTDDRSFPTTSGSLQQTFIEPGPDVFAMKISPNPSPTADLNNTTLNFGSWGQGVTSTKQTVTLSNNGLATLNISGITASGDFGETNTCGATLPVQASCFISITFTPTALGTRTGTVSIADDTFTSPQQVQLSGIGVSGAFAVLSASALNFGNQVVGGTSAAQTASITNTGNANMTLAVSINGEYAQTNTCPASLGSGASCSASVTFSPKSTGFRGGSLTFTDNAPGSPQSVALNGDGVTGSLNLGVPAGSSSSATVSAGGNASYTLAVGGGGIGGTVNLSCTGAPTAATCSVPSTVTANANTGSNFTVMVTTTAASGGLHFPSMPNLGPWWIVAVLGLVVIQLSLQKRYRLLALVPLLLALCSCGGGGGGTTVHSPGTPAGTYTLTVSATSGSANQSMQLTLKVQ
jgi:hypothetical protein